MCDYHDLRIRRLLSVGRFETRLVPPQAVASSSILPIESKRLVHWERCCGLPICWRLTQRMSHLEVMIFLSVLLRRSALFFFLSGTLVALGVRVGEHWSVSRSLPRQCIGSTRCPAINVPSSQSSWGCRSSTVQICSSGREAGRLGSRAFLLSLKRFLRRIGVHAHDCHLDSRLSWGRSSFIERTITIFSISISNFTSI